MKRLFDLLLAIVISALLLIPIILIALLVRLSSKGPALYWSDRIGRNNKIFSMPKFRSMRLGTPEVASHLLNEPRAYLTPIGGLLRKSSLDELPQLWSIIKGDMSFVGPRPTLFNEYELMQLRTQAGVHQLTPGLTGWAQINGRDMLTLEQKVALDVEYMKKKSLFFDLKIIFLTACRVVMMHNIAH